MFEKFKPIIYPLATQHLNKQVINIFQSITMQFEASRNTSLYYYYHIKDGERPEHIAYDVYDNSKLHYMILLYNNIVNPFVDWYIGYRELSRLITAKYGDSENSPHHFLDISSPGDPQILDDYHTMLYSQWLLDYRPIPHNVSVVTNAMYEHEKNKQRQEIKIIHPKYINKYVELYNDLLEGRIKNIEDM
jgi:hypothetical protein